jgi:dihydroorotate dehydrogenase electron transfer subunit
MMKQIEFQAAVVASRWIGDQTAILTLATPEIAVQAEPGQFVNLSCDRFLRRPLGIMAVDRTPGHETFSVGIRVQGEGTAWLADRKPGDVLSVLGPLGHGFALTGYRRVITVGGGTGVFPLHFVQQVCQERGLDSLAVCGYRSRPDSFLTDEFSGLGCRTLFASDAGDMDMPGNAAEALARLLADLPPEPLTAILSCGPKPMLQAVAAIAARNGLDCQVSLEERMACGIGVCLVCVCRIQVNPVDSKVAGQTGIEEIRQRCCVEGPVFDARTVIWS